jgi:transcriptional regulator with XRE-family HTH domain
MLEGTARMNRAESGHWSERLRQERIQRNWRQKDLADQLGATIVTVKRWEQGHHLPSNYFRQKLCILFKQSAEALGFPSEGSLSAEEIAIEVLKARRRTMRNITVPAAKQMTLLASEPHPLVEEIKQLAIDELTPIEAINKLYELQQKAHKEY